MTDQRLIENLIRRNTTLRTLSNFVIQAHERSNPTEFENALYALKAYLKSTPTQAKTSESVIKLWPWSDAPEEYRALSDHGGDEDWVMLIPADMAKGGIFRHLPTPLEEAVRGDSSYIQGFGHVGRYELESGEVVLIFAHV